MIAPTGNALHQPRVPWHGLAVFAQKKCQAGFVWEAGLAKSPFQRKAQKLTNPGPGIKSPAEAGLVRRAMLD
jgi:hypothetical protein